MFNWVRHLFSRKPAEPLTMRRWDAAQTHRLNQAHWASATGQSINADLATYLETLRIRCLHEAANNPMVEGVIHTHAVDIVGSDGPALQVLGGPKSYGDKLEELWRQWWAMPDVAGQMSGADFLQQWVRMLWCCGEWLAQIVTDNGADEPIKTRLLSLHPRRLASPPEAIGDEVIALGVRRTKSGKPVAYYIAEELAGGVFALQSWKTQTIAAANIIHGYRIVEPGQARGYPWLSAALSVIADLRDYDVQVLDAARMAANFGIVLSTSDPSVNVVEVNESTELERGTMRTAPPGYAVNQVSPQQPSTQYVDYRAERQREIGRAVNMPLMMVRLDSQNHNYSSARFDAQIYQRGLRSVQSWIARVALDRLVNLVAREAQVARELPEQPKDVRYQWTWPMPPHVDPKKEADAERTRLESGTLTYAGALAAHGLELDSVIAQRQREKEQLEEAGLPPLPTPQSKKGKDDDDDDDNKSTQKGGNNRAQFVVGSNPVGRL